MWTDSGLKSAFSVRELTSTQKNNNNNKTQAGNEWSNIFPKFSRTEEKATTITTTIFFFFFGFFFWGGLRDGFLAQGATLRLSHSWTRAQAVGKGGGRGVAPPVGVHKTDQLRERVGAGVNTPLTGREQDAEVIPPDATRFHNG